MPFSHVQCYVVLRISCQHEIFNRLYLGRFRNVKGNAEASFSQSLEMIVQSNRLFSDVFSNTLA